MMKTLLCEDGEKSFFTAVFSAYSQKDVERISSNEAVARRLDTELVRIEENDEYAERVKCGIIGKGGKETYENVLYALRSGDNFKCEIILQFIRILMKEGKKATDMLYEPCVLSFYDLVRKVKFETHRFEGFVRFSESCDGIFYAAIAPENDVTELLMPHFAKRCNTMDFLIHDPVHGKLGLYSKDSGVYKTENYSGKFSLELSENEKEIKKLFKTYFNTVTIKERKNPKQQNGYLPKKYRKNLPEFE